MAPPDPPSRPDAPLFRPEAIIAISGQGTIGSASVYQPVKLIALCGLVGCLVVLGVAYLFSADYPRRVTARGYILADGALSYLHADRDGIVAEMSISEGDTVSAGDVLMELAFPSGLPSGSDVNHVVEAELDYRSALLSEQMAETAADFEIRQEALSAAIRSTQEEIHQLDQVERSRSQQLRLATVRYKALEVAHKRNAVSPSTLLDAQKEIHDLQTAFFSGKQERLVLGRMLGQYRSEQRRLRLTRTSEMRQIKLRMSDIREQHARVQFAASMTIEAPVAGVVGGLQHRPGESVRHGDLLAVIDNGQRRAGVLHVPDDAAAFLPAGATVRLIFDAYPITKHGTWTGVIESVTNAPIAVEQLEGPLPAEAPAYVAKLRIHDRSEEGLISRVLPGMAYTAHITLESRSVGEWLLEPLLEALEIQG